MKKWKIDLKNLSFKQNTPLQEGDFMKKNILIIGLGLVLALSLVGCVKKSVPQTTTGQTTETTTQTQEQEKDKTDISIFTKDEQIEYEKYFDDNEVLLDFEYKAKENKLKQLENNEKIRIQFNEELPKDKKVSVSKIYIKQDGKGGTENIVEDMSSLEIDENGYIDITHSYSTEDKYLYAIAYEVIASWSDVSAKYIFGFKVDNNTTTDEKQYTVTGYLSSDEQKIYDNYKKDTNDSLLSNASPVTIAKLYAQAIIEENYDLAYSLYGKSNELPTKEEYIKIMNGLNNDAKQQYVNNVKSVENGSFIEDSDNSGYIQYELVADHPMAMDMIKENGVWKLKYMPIE